MVTCDNFKQSRIQCLVFLLKMINCCRCHTIQVLKRLLRLVMLFPNQFNKRSDLLIISVTWLWLFSNLILCYFDIFDNRGFGFVSIRFIVFFVLVTILIMTMFNFQFWVGIKIGSWYYLTCCIFPFFYFFMCCLTNQAALELWNYMLFS